MIKDWIRAHRYYCILIAVFVLGSAAFVYSYVQPRYTATVVSVGKVQHKSGSSGKHRRSGRDYQLAELTVRYTDANGKEIVTDASYRCESIYSVPRAGEEVVLVQGFRGLVRYPFTTLRYLGGFLAAGMGLLLGMELFAHIVSKRRAGKENTENQSNP